MFYSDFWNQTEKENQLVIVVDWTQQSYKKFNLVWPAGSTPGRTSSFHWQTWISQSRECSGGFPNAKKGPNAAQQLNLKNYFRVNDFSFSFNLCF